MEQANAWLIKGNQPDSFTGDNKETFVPVTAETWAATVKQLNQILSEWEHVVAAAEDAKLKKNEKLVV